MVDNSRAVSHNAKVGIAGSAAFNLLVITSVCIMSVPEGEIRKISDFPVFMSTAFFSLWAYFWMLIVYKFWTPNQVTILEAILTLAWLPLMVSLAYVINVRPWVPKPLLSEIEDKAADADDEAAEVAPLDAGYATKLGWFRVVSTHICYRPGQAAVGLVE